MTPFRTCVTEPSKDYTNQCLASLGGALYRMVWFCTTLFILYFKLSNINVVPNQLIKLKPYKDRSQAEFINNRSIIIVLPRKVGITYFRQIFYTRSTLTNN